MNPQFELVACQPGEIGSVCVHPTLGKVKITDIHPAGTIDVRNIFSGNCYRITGLPMGIKFESSFKFQRIS